MFDFSSCYIIYYTGGKDYGCVRFEKFKDYKEMLETVKEKALSYEYNTEEQEGLDKTVLIINNWTKHELEFDDIDKVMRGFIALTRTKEENETIIGYGYPGEIFRHFFRDEKYWSEEESDFRQTWETGGFDPSDKEQAKTAENMFERLKQNVAIID